MSLQVLPSSLKEINELVALWHRHHPRARGCKFALVVLEDERICGGALVGRPKARALQNRTTGEVARVFEGIAGHSHRNPEKVTLARGRLLERLS